MNSGFQVNMMTLAEHIIEATPDRIKQENFVPMESSALEKTDTATISGTMSWLASYLADVDHLPSAIQIRSVYVGFQWQRGRPVGLVGGGGVRSRQDLFSERGGVRTSSGVTCKTRWVPTSSMAFLPESEHVR